LSILKEQGVTVKRIYGLGATFSGAEVFRDLSQELEFAGIIGLPSDFPSSGASGFVTMKDLANDIGADFIPVESYSLNSISDRERLLLEEIDILLVVGWQRLIPDWLISHCNDGAVGVHGGPNGISQGRGRSPQNWALILGAESFDLSIFLIDSGIDSGEVIATGSFSYTSKDDINTSYSKAAKTTSELIQMALRENRIQRGAGRPQTGPFYYFPQRVPEDGAIDWTRSPEEESRFVGALTRPYPGAFTFGENFEVKVWTAEPVFALPISGEKPFASEQPGAIVLSTPSGGLVIRCGEGYVLVENFELSQGNKEKLRVGQVCYSVDYRKQIQGIIERHMKRFPELAISPLLTAALT